MLNWPVPIGGPTGLSPQPQEEKVMPIVKVEMWPGRTRDQKAQLAKEITDSFERIGTPREATIVVFKEVPKDSWAQAGTLADEA